MKMQEQSIERFLYVLDMHTLVTASGVAREWLILTRANHAVFFDRNFSLNDWLRAQDRTYPISQSKPCHTYHFSVKNSIDKWVNKLLLYKGGLVALMKRHTNNDDAWRHPFSKVDNMIGEVLQP